jgi:hypothetical protein
VLRRNEWKSLSRERFQAVEIPGLKIFQYCGGINFATRNTFKAELLRLVDINPQKELIYRTKLTKYGDEVSCDVLGEEWSLMVL